MKLFHGKDILGWDLLPIPFRVSAFHKPSFLLRVLPCELPSWLPHTLWWVKVWGLFEYLPLCCLLDYISGVQTQLCPLLHLISTSKNFYFQGWSKSDFCFPGSLLFQRAQKWFVCFRGSGDHLVMTDLLVKWTSYKALRLQLKLPANRTLNVRDNVCFGKSNPFSSI